MPTSPAPLQDGRVGRPGRLAPSALNIGATRTRSRTGACNSRVESRPAAAGVELRLSLDMGLAPARAEILETDRSRILVTCALARSGGSASLARPAGQGQQRPGSSLAMSRARSSPPNATGSRSSPFTVGPSAGQGELALDRQRVRRLGSPARASRPSAETRAGRPARCRCRPPRARLAAAPWRRSAVDVDLADRIAIGELAVLDRQLLDPRQLRPADPFRRSVVAFAAGIGPAGAALCVALEGYPGGLDAQFGDRGSCDRSDRPGHPRRRAGDPPRRVRRPRPIPGPRHAGPQLDRGDPPEFDPQRPVDANLLAELRGKQPFQRWLERIREQSQPSHGTGHQHEHHAKARQGRSGAGV